MISESALLNRLVAEIKAEQNDLAKSSMLFPKPDPHSNGVQAGKYQGLERALEILDNIISADDEQERKNS